MNFSLHRKPGSKNWHVSFRLPIPDPPKKAARRKLFSRSTGKTTKGDAREAAERIVAAAAKEAGATTETGREIAGIVARAAAMAEKGELSVAEGIRMIERLAEIGGGGKVATVTLRQWCERWLADKGEGVAKGKTGKAFSQSTGLRYAGPIRHLLEALPEKADAPLLLLNSDDIERWKGVLRSQGRSGAGVNASLRILNTCLNAARKKGVIVANPAEAVEFVAQSESIRRNFAPVDVARLMAVAERDWQGAILLAAFGGLALSDAANVRWQQIDLAGGGMAYTRIKTGATVTLPLHPELAAWLMAQPATDDPEAFVLPTLAGRRTGGSGGLSAEFSRLMERAGIAGKVIDAEGEKGRARKALGFHSLRHSFVSEMANSGVAPDIRRLLAGHASEAVSEGYTHRSSESLRAAIEALPGLPQLPAEEGAPKAKAEAKRRSPKRKEGKA